MPAPQQLPTWFQKLVMGALLTIVLAFTANLYASINETERRVAALETTTIVLGKQFDTILEGQKRLENLLLRHMEMDKHVNVPVTN